MTEQPLRATISQRGVVFASRARDRQLLVVQRASDGGWELPGGRLDPGEDAVDGLRRELEEETGFEATVRSPVHTVTWENDAGRGRFAVYYYCEVEERSVSLSEEHDDSEWLSPPAARERLSDPQETAVDRALDAHLETTRGRQPETLTGDASGASGSEAGQ